MRKVLHHHIEWAKANLVPTAPRAGIFAPEEQDDVWMDFVGARGWIVFGKDYRWHREPAVLAAIQQHRVRAFYLWGGAVSKWEMLRSFAAAYPKILTHAREPGPFIYRSDARGRLKPVDLTVSAPAAPPRGNGGGNQAEK